MVADYLAGRQVDFITTREPGGTALGRRIRDAILDPESSGVEPLAELLLYAADRAQHVRKVIHPSLARGAVVLSDRFFDATTAFQGYGRKFDLELIAHLNELATGGIKPDLTLIFDLEVDDALSRVKHRSHVTNPDRLDSEPREFHESVPYMQNNQCRRTLFRSCERQERRVVFKYEFHIHANPGPLTSIRHFVLSHSKIVSIREFGH